MPRCHIDHLAVTAPTLEAGAAFVRQALGVAPEPGGQHPRMATHNLLLRLGDALYLEVIAPDPAAPAPARPRWFALDALGPDAAPALAAWVARTADIRGAAAACSEPLGAVEAMSRGNLNWLITIPADGAVPLQGVGPALIQWQRETHPALGLHDHGLSLVGLELFHPDPDRVSHLLASLDLVGPVTVSRSGDGMPHLVAHIATPHGPRVLAAASRPG